MSERIIERADEIAALLNILGNTKRLLIICHLREGEMSVGKIAESVNLSQSALSQHLAKLRQQNLVKTRREKQTIYYSLSSSTVRNLLGALDELFSHEDAASGSGGQRSPSVSA